jgi:hypothetical protein
MSPRPRVTHTRYPQPAFVVGYYNVCLTCGKRGYKTKSEAKRALRGTARSYGEPKTWWNVYECYVEDGERWFHIGHTLA